jgi:hypothetical protein
MKQQRLTITCTWDVTGTQDPHQQQRCYETATFNDTTCTWDVTGTQDPAQQPRVMKQQRSTMQLAHVLKDRRTYRTSTSNRVL